mgnify:CR=1 FL=1
MVRNQDTLSRIKEIKAEHPLWGYRRVWAYLKYREGVLVNRKRIYRLMKENNLLVNQIKKLKAKRVNYPKKIKATFPDQVWGIDMTKVMIPDYGWLYFVVILDWYTKKIVGSNLSSISKTGEWLKALNMAVNSQFPFGIRRKGIVSLVSDNGSQPTSEKFMRECSLLGIKQIFASYDNPKGNADTERVIRTLKEDLIWPREWANVYEFEDALRNWIKNYNEDYPHSSLNYLTPVEFEAKAKSLETGLINEASYSIFSYT